MNHYVVALGPFFRFGEESVGEMADSLEVDCICELVCVRRKGRKDLF